MGAYGDHVLVDSPGLEVFRHHIGALLRQGPVVDPATDTVGVTIHEDPFNGRIRQHVGGNVIQQFPVGFGEAGTAAGEGDPGALNLIIVDRQQVIAAIKVALERSREMNVGHPAPEPAGRRTRTFG